MKKLFSILLLLISFSSYAQMNTFGGIGLRVNDTTTYQTNAAAYHSAGYHDIYFNNQATSKHWDVWNGSAYMHVKTLGWTPATGGGGGGSGDVVGPGSATNNVPVLFDGTTGKLVKNSTPTGSGNPVLATSPTIVTPTIANGANIAGIVGTNVTNTPAGGIAATTSQAALNELDVDKLDGLETTRTVTATHTLDATDLANINAGKRLTISLNAASGLALEIPTNATRAFPIGTVIYWEQLGAGQVTITPLSGVTMLSPINANKSYVQYAEGYIRKTGTNTWKLGGSVTP